jgi:hypothetical protein
MRRTTFEGQGVACLQYVSFFGDVDLHGALDYYHALFVSRVGVWLISGAATWLGFDPKHFEFAIEVGRQKSV